MAGSQETRWLCGASYRVYKISWMRKFLRLCLFSVWGDFWVYKRQSDFPLFYSLKPLALFILPHLGVPVWSIHLEWIVSLGFLLHIGSMFQSFLEQWNVHWSSTLISDEKGRESYIPIPHWTPGETVTKHLSLPLSSPLISGLEIKSYSIIIQRTSICVLPVAHLKSNLRSRETRSRRPKLILGHFSITTKLRTRTLNSSRFDGEVERLSITFLGGRGWGIYFIFMYRGISKKIE